MTHSSREMNRLDIRTLATEYLEAALPPQDRFTFERHLQQCERCQDWFSSFQETIAGLRELSTDELTAETEVALMEQFRRSKRNRPRLVPDIEKDDKK